MSQHNHTNPILYNVQHSVAHITLAQPKSRNPLGLSVVKELKKTLAVADADPLARVVVIKAEGPVFCSGHNLKDVHGAYAHPDEGKQYFDELVRSCTDMMLFIPSMQKPVIAAVHAPATAAGCQLVASCHLAFAADTAWFATPGVNIGLFCSTPMAPVVRSVPNKTSLHMLLTGQPLLAAQAELAGLITKAVPPDQLEHVVEQCAQTIASKSPRTVANGLKLFHKQQNLSLKDAYDVVQDAMIRDMSSNVASEGITAFLEKRPPVFPS